MPDGPPPTAPPAARYPVRSTPATGNSLVDVLERVLDKGIVVAGDVTISIVDIELLSIKLRLVITSLDRAEEIGLDWWRSDPYFSSQARPKTSALDKVKTGVQVAKGVRELFGGDDDGAPADGLAALRDEIRALRQEHREWVEAVRGQIDALAGRPEVPEAVRREVEALAPEAGESTGMLGKVKDTLGNLKSKLGGES